MTRMISGHEELAIVRRQLTRVENALVDLHQEVFAKNPRNYAVFSESYIDMILELRAQIDAFLHIASAPAELPADGDNGTAGGDIVAPEAAVGTVGVAGMPESPG